MKKLGILCLLILCTTLSGCAETQQEAQKMELPAQSSTRSEAPEREPEGSTEAPPSAAEPETPPEDDPFSGKWQTADAPQYEIHISSGDGGSYIIEITWSGVPRGNVVWLAAGAYDDIWEGIAYVGAKYEDTAGGDGSSARIPVPEREEVTGLLYLEDDGALYWVEDFDHAGDDLRFERA